MTSPDCTFRIYLDASGGWRWRLVAPNGHRIAASGEYFDSRQDAVRAAELVRGAIGSAKIIGETALQEAA
jgi:uncharacterized protein YegP (UPF0339 family)